MCKTIPWIFLSRHVFHNAKKHHDNRSTRHCYYQSLPPEGGRSGVRVCKEGLGANAQTNKQKNKRTNKQTKQMNTINVIVIVIVTALDQNRYVPKWTPGASTMDPRSPQTVPGQFKMDPGSDPDSPLLKDP